jgi:hypothetical protein
LRPTQAKVESPSEKQRKSKRNRSVPQVEGKCYTLNSILILAQPKRKEKEREKDREREREDEKRKRILVPYTILNEGIKWISLG